MRHQSTAAPKYIALLGAGFSRNWGGWLANEVFEYLLGCPQITPFIRNLLFKHRRDGGYEGALGELQSEFYRSHDTLSRQNLKVLEDAILQMFESMDRGFETIEFESEGTEGHQISRFLSCFDSLFTLNQDLLLERHYFRNACFANPSRWRGWKIVGMRRDVPEADGGMGGAGVPGGGKCNTGRWVPGPQEVPANFQPYYKLHGSSNWRGTNNVPIMVGGTSKRAVIDHFPVLASLHRAFTEQLSTGHVRLVVIGYGFGDEHINVAIMNAADGGNLEIFLVDPEGIGVLDRNRVNPIWTPHELLLRLGPHLRGASRRGLREIFRSDHVERAKILGFARKWSG
jgi:hypothetical protein